MTDLSVPAYDSAEREALAELPNRIVTAFQPVTFQGGGYPFRVHDASGLWKYVDVMQELRFDGDFVGLLEGGLTESEFAAFSAVSEGVCRFAEARFRRQLLPHAALLRSVNVVRHIRFLAGKERPRVMEIGPGCGYLGALLLGDGFPYVATDVSQAFYLYQNHLWNHLTGGKVLEAALEKGPRESWPRLDPGTVLHLPWWHFVRLVPDSVPRVDIVTCNHALCEMHPDSLGFVLAMARAALQGDAGLKAFVFEGWGLERMSVREAVTQRFVEMGFVLAHNDPAITVFVPRETKGAAFALPLPRPIPRLARRLQNAARRLLHRPRLAPGGEYAPVSFASARNPVSRAILTQREADRPCRTVHRERLARFYTELTGRPDYLTPDEQFLRSIGISRT